MLHRPWKRPLIWLESGLWLVGIGLLVWVWWAWTDARLYQRWAEEALGEPAVAAPAAPPAEGGAVPASHASEAPAPGTPIARVRVPRLDLSAVVAEGTSPEVLRRAVGHLEDSAPPGGDGNVVLAAHRDSYFRPLEEIRMGDFVRLESPAGDATYRVEWVRVVEPSDLEVTADAGYPALTLVTCYPFRYIGPAPLRLVVRARRTAGG